jgi:hypothetical protein
MVDSSELETVVLSAPFGQHPLTWASGTVKSENAMSANEGLGTRATDRRWDWDWLAAVDDYGFGIGFGQRRVGDDAQSWWMWHGRADGNPGSRYAATEGSLVQVGWAKD